ncbi:MAG TPA: mechanosensitive ion channel domain-containing protein [Pontiella sp.]
MTEQEILLKGFISGVLLLGILLLFSVIIRYARKTRQKFGIRKSRYFAILRIIRILAIFSGLFALLLVWDVSLKNVWVHVTGILAVVAIAFFAVWSLVGNLLAGVIIYFTSPFKINDDIEVMPDEIAGSVLAINTFYTVLQDPSGCYINIPNSLFFQKYIRVKSGRVSASVFYADSADSVKEG